MKITINDRDIELKYSFRSIMLYENIQNKPFNPTSTTDIIVFMFCVILGSDKEMKLSFDDFLDYMDEHPEVIIEFSNWLTEELDKNRTLSPEEEKKRMKTQKK